MLLVQLRYTYFLPSHFEKDKMEIYDYTLRQLKAALRIEREIVREYSNLQPRSGKSIKYFRAALKRAKVAIPSLQASIKKLESK